MKSRNRLSLAFIVGLALLGVLLTLIMGWRPGLGLDLQGGASVVLRPVGVVKPGALEQARAIIAARVDGLGVGEPDIRTEDNRIVVEVPGVKDPQKIIDIVGQTAELRFRPVLQQFAAQPQSVPSSTVKGGKPATTVKGGKPATTLKGATTVKGATTTAGGPTSKVVTITSPTTNASTSANAPTTAKAPTTDGSPTTIGYDIDGAPGKFGVVAAAATTTPANSATPANSTTPPAGSTAPPTTTGSATTVKGAAATTVKGAPTTAAGKPGSTVPGASIPVPSIPTPSLPTEPAAPAFTPPKTDPLTGLTAREDDKAEATVVLADKDGTSNYLLGATLLDGTIVDTAIAELDPQTGGWQVRLSLTGKGSGLWDGMAAQMYQKQLAIVLDSKVISAPSINAQRFGGSAVISGNFTETEAKDLATVLRYGSLPVKLEQQTVQTVSASLGRDSLHAGLLTGLLGLLLVAIYMLIYYRSLGVVMVLGVGVSASLLWTLLSLLTKSYGLALSLSGVVGVIVSVGVTVDSYVVYFERLRDELRAGRSVQASIDRGFRRAWHTILAADGVSILGALVLYLLTAGSVRGFALLLMMSTALDMFVAWFFTRPMVALLANSPFFTTGRFGLVPGATIAPNVGDSASIIRPGAAGAARGGSK